MGSMFGGGGSSGGRNQGFVSQPDPAISEFTNEIRGQSRPVREETFRQVFEALRTGGIGARLPIAQRAVESSRSASSASLRELDEGFAQAGGRNNEFYQRIRALTSLAGRQETEGIPTAIAREWADIAPSLAMGSAQTVMQGLTSASQIGLQSVLGRQSLAAQRDIAKGQQTGQIMSSLAALGAAAGGAMAFT